MFLIFPLIKAFLNKICMSSYQSVKERNGPCSRVNDCLILFCLLPVLMLFFEVNIATTMSWSSVSSPGGAFNGGLFCVNGRQWSEGDAVAPHSDMWEVVYRLLVCQAVKIQMIWQCKREKYFPMCQCL